jgi:formate--tetrahydrofolate ligase
MQRYGVPVVVAINRFTADTQEELQAIKDFVATYEITAHTADVWGQGGAGAQELAQRVMATTSQDSHFTPLYSPSDSAVEKIQQIVQTIYGGAQVALSDKATKQLAEFAQHGWDTLPIIMAKTQYSLSDDVKSLGAPKDFTIHIREFIPKLGAGFLVALTGNVLTMPGLPKHPAAYDIDIDANETITGLF